MINTLSTLLTWLLVFGMGALEVHAAEEKGQWTRFRGPNGSGISTATNFPLKWTADDYNWQIDLPVMGSSSPVLWGKRLYLMGDHADDQQRSVLCINADSGRILWRRDYPVKRHRLHRDNDFTSATPCVDEHGVILVWSSPEQLLGCPVWDPKRP